MTITQEIEELIQKAVSEKYSFDPIAFLEEVSETLRVACDVGGKCDSMGDNCRDGQGGYFIATDFLAQNGFVSAAEQLLLGWWHDVSTRQLTEPNHIYRAGNAYKLTQLYLRQNDLGAALRWALLTQADDLLHRHEKGGGAGRQWLRTIFGASRTELDALKDIAFERFFSRPSSVEEFPLSLPYFRALLNKVSAPANNTKAKGDALEFLAAYLFLLIPGWFPSRNVLDENQSFETDIIISNLNPTGNLTAELLGRNFLVECKNWGTPIKVRDVGYFLHRMRLTHCGFGVLFAANDVTGRIKGETAARSLIRRTFHEDGNTCVVLDMSDLELLARGEVSFWSLLLREMQRFRFGKAK